MTECVLPLLCVCVSVSVCVCACVYLQDILTAICCHQGVPEGHTFGYAEPCLKFSCVLSSGHVCCFPAQYDQASCCGSAECISWTRSIARLVAVLDDISLFICLLF